MYVLGPSAGVIPVIWAIVGAACDFDPRTGLCVQLPECLLRPLCVKFSYISKDASVLVVPPLGCFVAYLYHLFSIAATLLLLFQ